MPAITGKADAFRLSELYTRLTSEVWSELGASAADIPGPRRELQPRDGFLLANAHDAVAAMFAGTRWRGGLWKKVLRRLPGAGDGGSTYWFAPAIASRATFVPWPSSLSDSGPE
mgnify:CR=1 FL=1